MQAGGWNADLLNPASASASRRAEHELTDMGAVARKLDMQAKQARKKTKPASVKVGQCGYAGCGISKPARPQLRCGSCKDGKGAYYHMECFFATHRCYEGSCGHA